MRFLFCVDGDHHHPCLQGSRGDNNTPLGTELPGGPILCCATAVVTLAKSLCLFLPQFPSAPKQIIAPADSRWEEKSKQMPTAPALIADAARVPWALTSVSFSTTLLPQLNVSKKACSLGLAVWSPLPCPPR